MCCDSIGLSSSECTLYCDVSHLKMYFIHQQISFIISHPMLPSIDPPRQSLNDKQDRVWLTNKAKVWLSNKAEFDWQTRQSLIGKQGKVWLANKAEFDWQTRQSLTGKQGRAWLAIKAKFDWQTRQSLIGKQGRVWLANKAKFDWQQTSDHPSSIEIN